MSRYSSHTVTIEARPANTELLTAALVARLGPFAEYLPSGDLCSAHTELAAATNPLELRRLLSNDVLWQTATPTLIAEARGCVSTRGSLSPDLRRQLDLSLASMDQHVLHAERVSVTALTVRALERIGFHVRSVDGRVVSGIEARRGHNVVLMAVDAGGQLEIDTISDGANTCESILTDVHAALASEGVTTTITRVDRHGNPRGGTLIDRAAAASSNGDLLEGLTVERDVAPLSPSQPVRSPLRTRQRGTH